MEKKAKAELARPRGQAYLLSCKEGAIALSDMYGRTDLISDQYMRVYIASRSIVIALYPSSRLAVP
jgi:hypothetical protein